MHVRLCVAAGGDVMRCCATYRYHGYGLGTLAAKVLGLDLQKARMVSLTLQNARPMILTPIAPEKGRRFC